MKSGTSADPAPTGANVFDDAMISHSETGYLDALAHEIDRALEDSTTLTALLQRAHGAPPDLVLRIAGQIRGERKIPERVEMHDAYDFETELHPLLYEWYFTRETAKFISELAFGAGEDWLCLGSPTVASDLVDRKGRVRLIDADPEVRSRFRNLRNHEGVIIAEMGQATSPQEAEVTVIDPPWYLTDILYWMKVARLHTKSGGTIIVPLVPQLTRPAAWQERETILASANRLGKVEMYLGKGVYSTPRFEQEAFAALGIGKTGDWRVADLMVIRDVKGRADWELTSPRHLGDYGWKTFTLGTQVIKLRLDAARSASELTAIPGCPGNVLTSVSERDPRRPSIGLWTSRNRVANVGDPSVVGMWLESLQAVGGRQDILKAAKTSPSVSLFADVLQLS